MKNYWKNKNILITGAAGFIGSNLAKDLVSEGASLFLVDNLERGKMEYITSIFSKVYFLNGDLRDEDFCEKICKNKDIVIHLASKVGGIGYYTSKPYEVMNDNIKIDSNMLNAVIKNGIDRYFYASSAHIYPIELQGEPESPAIFEDQDYPANPELSYGWAKLIAEKQIQYACEENPNLNVAMARYIGIYGENQEFALETGSVIPVFCHRAIKHPEIPFSIWGTGQETRSYCFIDDAIECTKLMIQKMDEKQVVGPLNVGQQTRIKIEDIAKKVIKISEKDVKIEFDETKDTLIWGQMCDCTKAFTELGWKAQTTLDEGLKRVYTDIQRRLK
tara:strand:+ start:1253 stop:2248 length:996 start_codon:yes stop_codon:yes gene_type:complete